MVTPISFTNGCSSRATLDANLTFAHLLIQQQVLTRPRKFPNKQTWSFVSSRHCIVHTRLAWVIREEGVLCSPPPTSLVDHTINNLNSAHEPSRMESVWAMTQCFLAYLWCEGQTSKPVESLFVSRLINVTRFFTSMEKENIWRPCKNWNTKFEKSSNCQENLIRGDCALKVRNWWKRISREWGCVTVYLPSRTYSISKWPPPIISPPVVTFWFTTTVGGLWP